MSETSPGSVEPRLDDVPHMVWAADPAGATDYHNRQCVDYSGLPLADVLGRGWERMVHPDDVPACRAAWTAGLAAGGTFGFDCRFRRRDGAYLWHAVRANPVRGPEGVVARWVGTCTDVSAAREADARLRQAHKLDAVGRLAAGVAHDFNNMLAVIAGHAELLLAAHPPGDPAHASAGQIAAAAARAAALTRQLLALGGRQALAPALVDAGEVVRGAEGMLRGAAGPGVRVVLDAPPGPAPVWADRGELERAVVNLAVNARDAMPGGGTLTVSARVEAGGPGGPAVVVAVADTGGGMAADVLARAGEPFFTTKGPGRGTGLGLAAVRGFAAQSGGGVEIDSAPGRGTTVRVRLPRAVTPVTPPPAPAADRPSPPPTPGPGVVLVADDDDAVRALTCTILRNAGYAVVEAADGEAAVWAAAAGPVGVLLADVVMPGLTGPEAAERVTRLRPGARVVFTSGSPHAGAVPLPAGAAFLGKPFAAADLLRAVRDALDTPAVTGG